jgi:hypothetical protein
VRELSATLSELAPDLGHQAARQHAANHALEVLRKLPVRRDDTDAELVVALAAVRIAVTDLMLFVGVDPDEAFAVARSDVREREPEVRDETLEPKLRRGFLEGWLHRSEERAFRRRGRPS